MPTEAEPGQEPVATTDATTAETTAPVATTAPAETATDPFDNPELESFERTYVEKIRNEAAKHRTEAKPFKDAFDGYDEGSRNVLLNVVNLLKTDPAAGAAALREIAEAVSPAEAKAITEAITDAAAEDDTSAEEEGLSVDEIVERKLAAREEAARNEAAVNSVIKQAEELGYPAGDPDHVTLLWIANYQTDGDLAAAAKVLEGRNQSIIDKYIASKTDANGRFVTPTAGQTPSASDAEPKTWGNVRDRVRARAEAATRGGDQ